ncbi:MAG: IPT/TIG domain-containing protein [Acidobacteriota bacterium]
MTTYSEKMARALLCGAFLLCATEAAAQTPVIGSVVNSASYDARLAPGVLAFLYGSNFGSSTSTTVTIAGKAAAVIYASPTQFGVQIPVDAVPGITTAQIGSSAPFAITLGQYAPGLFSVDQSGKGIVIATNSGGAVSAANPAKPGEAISLFATGLGATSPVVATGVVTPATPLASTVAKPTVTIGGQAAAVSASVLSPGQVGVYQVNLNVPAGLADGSYPVVLTIGGSASNSLTLPVSAKAAPSINGVVSATGIPGSVQPNVESGSWVAIYGTNLADITTDWTGKIVNGVLPTELGGVTVTIGGRAAYLYYVSPTQINVQAPEVGLGQMQVLVNNNGRVSVPGSANVATHAPAFFQWGPTKYAIATRYPDNNYLANPTLGAGFSPAKPGNVVILWATGFGPTNPQTSAGSIVSNAATTATLPTVTVGGKPVSVIGAAVSPGLVGVYQVAIQLPDDIPPGDVLVRASIGGVQTPDNVYLFVVASN